MLSALCKACAVILLSGNCAFAQSDLIEPNAGTWKTWVITSGKDFRVPPPPDTSATELEQLHDLVAKNDAQVAAKITFWDAGSPGYRWIDLVNNRVLTGQPIPNAHRIYTYLTMAMYDATIAAWESKYFYNRPRPSEADATLPTALPTPRSPSYPSEHAAAAGAAATVLSYFFPDEASSFQAMAEEAAQSRVLAGVQFPSDSSAGLELGRRVAEQVIARAKADGSDAVWTGTVPTGPCMWVGDKPGNVTMPNWKPIVLASADEFRPPAPPDCQSATVKAETDAVRQFERKFPNNYKAFYWQSPSGLFTSWYDYASKWMFEDNTDSNPPRAARAYSMLATVHYDAFIASNDGKFAYWYLRPNQLDPSITPLFAVPPFPSYPSNHSTLSTARCEILAYLFPSHAEFIRAVGKEAGDSRIWAGIHYEMDNRAGVTLGKAVAGKFIERARKDGAD
ncbi:phosphatase PAP2 family protein [Rhizobium ruizarguesonis]|jgi:membrane-associated phospholipid phosphatase|uniref:phosphatase PAP2 family protein n=1 Tax=Rhizobium TaxID=379 RepID=UPI001CF464CF|nr:MULTISPECIES: phosphatase PAP2 family protein [Rhizobium]MCB2406020.1 phosphatase PAP2 family protein [Rhizobium ruizarguesonis]UIJ80751.1 phosphatase PAP2 family protein [Rhizobium leguminosarum]